jgi:2,3-bisphosphoglycerate-dependent phosphoglycerate mutase
MAPDMPTSSSEPRSRVVLLRHAQSQWNLENRFTGWTDVDLSAHGVAEAYRAAALLKRHGLRFDRAFVSYLLRSTRTLDIVLQEIGQPQLPVERDWRLNERHYGALQGLNKKETADRYGTEQFFRWRRGYADRPPALEPDDPRHPRHDPMYTGVDPARLPATESLADTERRAVEHWREAIVPRIRAGETVLVVAHGNSLRGLVKYLDGISDADVERLEIPTGVPLVYEFDRDARPLRHYYLRDEAAGAPASAA